MKKIEIPRWLLWAFVGVIILLLGWLVHSCSLPTAYNPTCAFVKLSEHVGAARIEYVKNLSAKDLEIKYLQQQLLLRPVETQVITKLVYKEYESEPQAHVELLDENTYRVLWEDPRAQGYLDFRGFDLRSNEIIKTHLQIYPFTVTVEAVQSGDTWYWSDDSDLVEIVDGHVRMAEPSIWGLTPRAIFGIDDSGLHVGAGFNARVHGADFGGYYVDDNIWGGYAHYTLEPLGLGAFAGCLSGDVLLGVDWKLDF